jgi:tetratricopeptide (TPR) repeat protein
MDKGFHEIHDLEDAKRPKLITHGSISFSMNYHALAKYCELKKGNVMFPSYSTYDVEVGVLMFLEKNDSYNSLKSAYQLLIDDFGPDDFTGIKKFLYTNVSKLNLQEIIGFIRLGAYDGTIFKNLLPKIKHLKEEVTFNDRRRLSQTMHKVWDMYFDIGSSEDLAYEIGGVYYDLGFYENALFYFNQSINRRGTTPDAFYNIILCYYQLRQDDSFIKNLTIAKTLFPDYENFIQLEKLDLEAS